MGWKGGNTRGCRCSHPSRTLRSARVTLIESGLCPSYTENEGAVTKEGELNTMRPSLENVSCPSSLAGEAKGGGDESPRAVPEGEGPERGPRKDSVLRRVRPSVRNDGCNQQSTINNQHSTVKRNSQNNRPKSTIHPSSEHASLFKIEGRWWLGWGG